MTQGKDTVFVPGGPAYVFGKKNEAFQGGSKAQDSSDSNKGTAQSAHSDFPESQEESVEILYPEAIYESTPDVDYLLDDEDYLEHIGYDPEDGEKPMIDYDDYYVQDVMRSDEYFALDQVKETVNEWIDNLDDEYTDVLIEGKNMGWMRRSGMKIISLDELSNNPVYSIAPDTDVTQTWRNDNGVLTVTQSHHDAPTGESYTFKPLTDEEREEMEVY